MVCGLRSFNHMKNYKERFSFPKKPEKLEKSGVVETGDDTPHPIEHIGDVFMKIVVDQGMQVLFTHHGCFIEEEGWIIT